MSEIENLHYSAVRAYCYETPISRLSHRRVNANEESNTSGANRLQFSKISQDSITSLALQLFCLGMKIVGIGAGCKTSFKTQDANIVLALDFNEHRFPRWIYNLYLTTVKSPNQALTSPSRSLFENRP